MMRKTSVLVIALYLLVSSFAFGAGGDMGVGTEPLTDGSAAYPYLIEDFADFQVFADSANSATYWVSGIHTKLIGDLYLTGQTYNAAVISSSSSYLYYQGTAYNGIFDGNGYCIRDMEIDDGGSGKSYLALFGNIGANGVVKNLSIEHCTVTAGGTTVGGDYIGGIAALNYGTITNCYVEGTINGRDSRSGVLCAENNGGNIESCYSTGTVTGLRHVGGLCGYNNDGTIRDCYSSADVTGPVDSFSLGGLCGENGNGGNITQCYASGKITGEDYMGGFCGKNYNSSTIRDCYAIGDVNGITASSAIGGFCGWNDEGSISKCYSIGSVAGDDDLGGFCGYKYYGSITNCFWDIESSNFGNTGDNNYGATGKTTIQMQDISTFVNASWDFNSNDGDSADWFMGIVGYPWLYWQPKIFYAGETSISLEQGDIGHIELEVFSPVDELLNWTITGYTLCSWIVDLDPDTGSSTGPTDNQMVIINVNSDSVTVGDYSCDLTIAADNGDSILLPISLNVFNFVNLKEFSLLAQYWLMTGCNSSQPCSQVDWYIDRKIDILDLNQLAISWLGNEIITYSTWEDYFENFSGGQPTEGWSYYSTSYGRIQVIGGKLRMDSSVSGIYSLNEAVLTIDLSGQSNVMLSFFQAESGDELHSLPVTFTGHENGDGVSVSNDGITWHQVFNASELDEGIGGQTFTVNLDDVGIAYTSDFRIKFQQYDNYPWSSDGREFDNIEVTLGGG